MGFRLIKMNKMKRLFYFVLVISSIGLMAQTSQFSGTASLGSLTVNGGGTLRINGQNNKTAIGTNLNNGTLIIKGTLNPTIGTVVLTIGGGVTATNGLTFPNFTID